VGTGSPLDRATKKNEWLCPPGPCSPGLKIGLLGGSFNPAHEGHLYISELALKQLGLDYVWWLVSPQNPLKPVAGMAPLRERLSYAARKYEHHLRIIVVDVETTFGTRYTVETLGALKRRFHGVNFVWLMGSDNLAGFHHWRRWREIATRVPIAVALRPGSTKAALSAPAARFLSGARKRPSHAFALSRPPALAILDGRRCHASATAIRAKMGFSEAMVGAIPSW
jgi:nicotinate-nucleotide adenylyltransferase